MSQHLALYNIVSEGGNVRLTIAGVVVAYPYLSFFKEHIRSLMGPNWKAFVSRWRWVNRHEKCATGREYFDNVADVLRDCRLVHSNDWDMQALRESPLANCLKVRGLVSSARHSHLASYAMKLSRWQM